MTKRRRIENMSYFLLAFTFLIPTQLLCQIPVTSPEPTKSALTQSLVGDWVGVLEYRDYSEPLTSTKRVQLPTWLQI